MSALPVPVQVPIPGPPGPDASYGAVPVPAPAGAGGPTRPHLYVGNLSPRVTESMLRDIFSVTGPIQTVKIVAHGGYGFVEYVDMHGAEMALQTLNGRLVFEHEIRLNWAKHSHAHAAALGHAGAPGQGEGGMRWHVFVGDLGAEIGEAALHAAFGAFASLTEVRVMWDAGTGKSRGFGFVSFRERADAEQAIATMNGEWIGSRAIRVNWANQKLQRPPTQGAGAGAGAAQVAMGYEQVHAATPASVTTVYVGNLPAHVGHTDLVSLLSGYGYIVDIRIQHERGYAFVKLSSHDQAANAVYSLSIAPPLLHGRQIRISWGKERTDPRSPPPHIVRRSPLPPSSQTHLFLPGSTLTLHAPRSTRSTTHTDVPAAQLWPIPASASAATPAPTTAPASGSAPAPAPAPAPASSSSHLPLPPASSRVQSPASHVAKRHSRKHTSSPVLPALSFVSCNAQFHMSFLSYSTKESANQTIQRMKLARLADADAVVCYIYSIVPSLDFLTQRVRVHLTPLRRR